jgi:hypothetical protein
LGKKNAKAGVKQGLDFVVGGIPRGGTTAHAEASNFFPEVACYAFETHLIPTLCSIAGEYPVPPEALPGVESTLRTYLQQAFVDLPNNISHLFGDRYEIRYRYTPAELADLSAFIMERIRSGEHGAALIQTILIEFAKGLRAKSGRPIVGEKTPTNIGAVERFGMVGVNQAFLVVREPMGTVKSMRGRVDLEGDEFNWAFQGGIWRQMGLWIDQAETVLSALRHAGTSLWRYEDLLAQPKETARRMAEKLGAAPDDAVLDAAAAQTVTIKPTSPVSAFPLGDAALVWSLTGPVRRELGYADDLHGNKELEASLAPGRLDIPADSAVWLSGLHAKSEAERQQWMKRRGLLAVCCSDRRKRLRLKFWLNLPGYLEFMGADATLRLIDYRTGALLPDCPVGQPGKSQIVTATINLRDIEPSLIGAASNIRLIRFEASHFFRPFLVPLPGEGNAPSPGILSMDEREIACSFLGAEFD